MSKSRRAYLAEDNIEATNKVLDAMESAMVNHPALDVRSILGLTPEYPSP